MSEYCRCGSRGPDNPCNRPMTQEDGLCDGCRVNYCVPRAILLPLPPVLAQSWTGVTVEITVPGRWEIE